MFRARRKPEVSEETFVETKYRCRSGSHEWWERVSAPAGPKKAEDAA